MLSKQLIVRCKFYSTSYNTLFCRINSRVGRNVLDCCQRYNTNIDSLIWFDSFTSCQRENGSIDGRRVGHRFKSATELVLVAAVSQHRYSAITCRFDINNIDRIDDAASDDFCNRVTMLNKLLQCRDGMLCLSVYSFNSNDVEQLVSFVCIS